MSKRQILLVGIAGLLAGVYVFYFSGWFGRKNIEIYHTVRLLGPGGHARGRAADSAPTYRVAFALDQPYELTEVKVLVLADLLTNRYAQPVWHLVSDSNSAPTRGFYYGQRVPGMRPAAKGARPEPLKPDVPYRLIIQAGKIRGEHDFRTASLPPAKP